MTATHPSYYKTRDELLDMLRLLTLRSRREQPITELVLARLEASKEN